MDRDRNLPSSRSVGLNTSPYKYVFDFIVFLSMPKVANHHPYIYPLSRPVYASPRLAVVLAIDGPTPTTGYSVASCHIMALYL